MDKNEAMIRFLMTCPTIQNNPLFFNFAEEASGNNHFITENDTKKKTYIDGSTLKQYTFSIASYFAVSHNAVLNDTESGTVIDENIENMAKVQEVLDWIDEQSDALNYPDFGPDCEIESMETLTTDPDIDGIDTSVNPPLARYSVGVKLMYRDYSKTVWNS